MLDELRELWNYRELLFTMVRRDLKVRYKNSLMGFMWSLINPALTVAVMSFAFSRVSNVTIPNMSAYLLAAYLPFMFFSMALMDSTGSVLSNIALVKKIYFPREILPLTAVISNFIHFLFALVMFFVYLLVVWIVHPGQIPFQWTTIFLPIILVINFFLVAGLGLMFSAWNTFFEDVKYMVGLGTSMLLFLSPIMWLSEPFNFEHHWQYVAELIVNPMTILCNSYRRMLLAPPSWTEKPAYKDAAGHLHPAVILPALPIQWKYIAYLAVMSVFIFLLGYRIFNGKKWKFVERP